MAVRLQFDPRRGPPDLLDGPRLEPLATWDHPRPARMARGQSRHVVRFVSDGERAYALKEMPEQQPQREYGMLRQQATERLPVVEPVGLVTGHDTPEGEPLDGVLATRYRGGLARRLVDAGSTEAGVRCRNSMVNEHGQKPGSP
jgi:hypothetical protein